MVEAAAQRGREIVRRVGFEARNDSTPFSGDQRHRYLSDAQMTVRRIQAALGFYWKNKIPVPFALGDDVATGGPNGQRKLLIREEETLAINPNPRLKTADGCRAMMVAIVGQQSQPQGQPILQRIGPRSQ